MALPTPNLDDLRFQKDIMDQVRRMIPHYCPEWTDHNLSDPGITLLELFAWMTELLLYRVNQVPDKMYIKFLELLGMQLEGPRAARAPVTFYLSAPQEVDVTIPRDTEVATLRTETSAALIFTTELDLPIRLPSVAGLYTGGPERRWVTYNYQQLGISLPRIALFPLHPAPGDAFYIRFKRDHSHHLLALILQCEQAGGAGVREADPPIEWQVYRGGPDPWVSCGPPERDETGGFNRSGEILLHLPEMVEHTLHGDTGYWLRCRLTEGQNDPGNSYSVPPDIERLRVEARGGTTTARHAITESAELLGRSEGVPGQRFRLLHTPVLARDPERDYLQVEPPNNGTVERWHEVADFADSSKDDRHYTLDSADGTLTLGPMLLQPDGKVWHYGAVPLAGSLMRFTRYQHGGGTAGNLVAGALTVLKSSVPYVARVANREPAAGGRNAQSVEDARLRAPRYLRTRNRAVTADDFEYLASQLPDVARACCLTPGPQPGPADAPPPGRVTVLILPRLSHTKGYIAPEQMHLSAQLKTAVESELRNRCVLGIRPEVREPDLLWVRVEAELRLPQRAAPAMRDEVIAQAEQALYSYLSPYTGGPGGDGWPFERDLHVAEIYSLLQRVLGVEFVQKLSVVLVDPLRQTRTHLAEQRLSVNKSSLICSFHHHVTVS